MKNYELEELKNPSCIGPFYSIYDKTKLHLDDERACGCATQAALNLVCLAKEKLGIRNGKSAYEELLDIQKTLPSSLNTVQRGTF